MPAPGRPQERPARAFRFHVACTTCLFSVFPCLWLSRCATASGLAAAQNAAAYVIDRSSQPFLNTGFTYLFASLLFVNSIRFGSHNNFPSTRVATAPRTIHSV